MQEILKDRLNFDDNLLCQGEFFHVRCCAHILNLIVQDGLAVIDDVLIKIRETVKYVKGSMARKLKLAECIEGNSEVVLSLDVQTQWNSTYLMLRKALKYQRAFSNFKVVDKNYKYCPSSEEWKRAVHIFEILKPFYSVTTLMSGTSYSTSNTYFFHIWKIQCVLEVHKNNEDALIREMVKKMWLKFDKYWKDYSIILGMSVVFDPRMKFNLLKKCYNELDPSSTEAKINRIKSRLYKLFKEYRKNFPLTPVVSSSRSDFQFERGRDTLGVLDDLLELDDIPNVMEEEGKSALDMYLEDPKLDIKNHPDMNVLKYWKENGRRFGALSYMAMDVLSIPITTVASEYSFSIGSHIINKYRSRLLPSNVQALLCTRSWLFGYGVDDEEGEMVIVRTDPESLKEA